MKKTLAIYIVFIMMSAILFGACQNEPMSTERLGKGDGVRVEYLFEKDGIKVYRFNDGGRDHYFTTRGETMSTQTAGKTSYQENIN
jgi:hypothetical protein